MNVRCTTAGCDNAQIIHHPSLLCWYCYQKHKQELRDGKELIE
jgi:hypothetical protein